MRRHILERSSPAEAADSDELPVNELLSGWVWKNQEPIVIGNIGQEIRFPRALRILSENGVKSCCCLPLTTAHRCLGALTLGSVREQAYARIDLEFMRRYPDKLPLRSTTRLTSSRRSPCSNNSRANITFRGCCWT